MIGGLLLRRDGALGGVFDGELDQLGQPLVMLLEQAEGAQGLDAGGGLCRERELAGGAGVLVDGDGGVRGLGCIGGGFGMVMRLERCCQLQSAGTRRRSSFTLIRGAGSMAPYSES